MLEKIYKKLEEMEKQNLQLQNSMLIQEKELTNLYSLLALLLEESENDGEIEY